jgi:predicted AlkP superfamily phosphohydrolase/phosphomutase
MDGAEPSIINRLIERGELPNISKVMREGASGTLTSTVPAISAPAWASFMTGVQPGKHGIFGFESRVSRGYVPRLVTSADISAPTVFDMLSAAGKRVAAVNVVMSYPPKKLNGILVAGFLAPMEALIQDFTYPPELAGELARRGYKVEPEVLIYQSKQRYVDEVFSVMEKRAEVAMEIFNQERWDCFMVVFTSVDRLQHRFWQMMDPEGLKVSEKDAREFGDVIYESYRRCDKYLGQLLEGLDEDTHLFLISDHGFAKAGTNINLHNWLVEEGLLKVNIPRSRRLLLSRYRMMTRVLGRTGLMRFVTMARSRYPRLFRKMTGQLGFYGAIDWAATKAYVIEKSIHINLKGRDPLGIVEPGEEFEALRDELTRKLLAVRDPASGRLVVKSVERGEKVYSGPLAHLGGDLVLTLNEGFRHWPRLAPGAPVFTREQVFCSYHHDQFDGFLAASGPGVKRMTGARQSIADVTPTILHILGAPQEARFDGAPMLGLYEETAEVRSRAVAVPDGGTERERARERIRALRSRGQI